MEAKRIHFVAGLPRAGSTLLLNILAQNPTYHVTATSGILQLLAQARNSWSEIVEFKAAEQAENEIQRNNVLKGLLHSYFQHVEKPVCFDKSRGWLAFAEMAKLIVGADVKFLVPVRDLCDVMASFEKLYRSASANRQVSQENQFYIPMQSAIGRCEVLLRTDQPVGIAKTRIQDAITRGFRENMLFVEYGKLTKEPAKSMQEIYEFLGDEPYTHDFENVVQVTQENDEYHMWGPSLHTIRAKVAPQDEQWKKVYDRNVTKSNFWKNIEDEATFWRR